MRTEHLALGVLAVGGTLTCAVVVWQVVYKGMNLWDLLFAKPDPISDHIESQDEIREVLDARSQLPEDDPEYIDILKTIYRPGTVHR